MGNDLDGARFSDRRKRVADAKRGDRIERTALTKAEAKRDVRYAARQARR